MICLRQLGGNSGPWRGDREESVGNVTAVGGNVSVGESNYTSYLVPSPIT
jgi:hypothetical protein